MMSVLTCFAGSFDSVQLFLLQDLVMWMKRHNDLLRGPEGSVQDAFAEVCAVIEEDQAASQTVPG